MSFRFVNSIRLLNKSNCLANLATNVKHTQACVRNISLSVGRFDDQKGEEQSKKSSEKRFKIYTRTGDKGTTSLFTGERRPKNDPIFDALGNTDELNSCLGLAREFTLDLAKANPKIESTIADIDSKLSRIQSTLLDIGSHIATPKSRAQQKQLERIAEFNPTLTRDLELWMDKFDLELPPLRNFILPSGGKAGSVLHLSRSICRRLERSIHPLVKANELDLNVGIFVNRLSDFLFVLARYVALKEGKTETVYKKP